MNVHEANTGRTIVALISKRPYTLNGEHVDWQPGLTGVVRVVESHGSNPWTRYTVRFDDGGYASGLIYGRDFTFTDHTGACGWCTKTNNALAETNTTKYGLIELCPTCQPMFASIVARP